MQCVHSEFPTLMCKTTSHKSCGPALGKSLLCDRRMMVYNISVSSQHTSPKCWHGEIYSATTETLRTVLLAKQWKACRSNCHWAIAEKHWRWSWSCRARRASANREAFWRHCFFHHTIEIGWNWQAFRTSSLPLPNEAQVKFPQASLRSALGIAQC